MYIVCHLVSNSEDIRERLLQQSDLTQRKSRIILLSQFLKYIFIEKIYRRQSYTRQLGLILLFYTVSYYKIFLKFVFLNLNSLKKYIMQTKIDIQNVKKRALSYYLTENAGF